MTLLSHAFRLSLGATAGLYLVAVLVGFTLVYVGAHYPRDVLGGAVWGLPGAFWRRWWIPIDLD